MLGPIWGFAHTESITITGKSYFMLQLLKNRSVLFEGKGKFTLIRYFARCPREKLFPKDVEYEKDLHNAVGGGKGGGILKVRYGPLPTNLGKN